MITDSEEQHVSNQNKIRRDCETTMIHFFDFALHTITNFYPDAELLIPNKTTSEQEKINLEESIKKQFEICKTWIREVFDQAIQISVGKEYNETSIEPIHFIPTVTHRIFGDLLKVLSERGSISDDSLIFLGEVGKGLGIDPKTIDISIEQTQYEQRKIFTERLKMQLSEEQLYWVALMLWTAIHIDRKVDYREYKYFENIMQLINFDHKKLIKLKEDSTKPIKLSEPFIDLNLCDHVYRYIIEIVMIDENYCSEEAEFIQELGGLLGYDKAKQDEIIQPTTSTVMLRNSLFSG